MVGGHRIDQHPRFELDGLWGVPDGDGFGEGVFGWSGLGYFT